MSTNGSGYIKLHRKMLDSWQASKPEWAWAWVTMLLIAEWEDNPKKGLLRGQFFASVRELGQRLKMSKSSTHRFISRCIQEKDVICESSAGGTVSGTVGGTVSGTHKSRYTIVKFNNYQPSCGTVGGTHSETSSPNSDKKKKKELKNTPGGVPPVSSDNSQVYDFYIETRREKCLIPSWEPTASQAKQMRANIKKLLDKGNSAEEIISWLTNYFADDRQAKDKWPWTFFMSDPVRWSGPTEHEEKPYWED